MGVRGGEKEERDNERGRGSCGGETQRWRHTDRERRTVAEIRETER